MILIDPARQQNAMERVMSGALGGTRWQMAEDPSEGEPSIKKTNMDRLAALARKHTREVESQAKPKATTDSRMVLDETQVRIMRLLVKRGMSQRDAWQRVAPGVSKTAAFRAIQGETWRELIVFDDKPASAAIVTRVEM